MSVKIRLKRVGQKKQPFYRIIVADERSPRNGRFIAEIGSYDPNQEPSLIKFSEEETKKWLQNGAQPTDRVAKLLQLAGISGKAVEQADKKRKEKVAQQAAAAAKKAAEKAAADKAAADKEAAKAAAAAAAPAAAPAAEEAPKAEA